MAPWCRLVLLPLLTLALTAGADERVALVIGNGKYDGEAALKNPAHDAEAIAAALTRLDFKVTKKVDVDLTQFEDAVVAFSRALKKNSVALFFYAGHGVQVKGENFLVPINARIQEEFQVKDKCFKVDQALGAMDDSKAALKIMVLDCCRDNPFTRSWTRGVGGRGLASIADLPDGTIIAFSTSPGKTALDGKGANSPYSKHLAAALQSRPTEGLELREAFFEASRAVKKETGQVPWLNLEASLDRYYLWKPTTPATPKPAAVIAETQPAPTPIKPSADVSVREQKDAPPPEKKKVTLDDASEFFLPSQPVRLAKLKGESNYDYLMRIGGSELKPDAVATGPDFDGKPSPSPTPGPKVSPSRQGAQSSSTITNDLGLTLALIPAGTFRMGSPHDATLIAEGPLRSAQAGTGSAGGQFRAADEKQVEVKLTRSFYLAATEITQGQWKAVMGSEPWKGRRDAQIGANYPASYVTWNDAREFCLKLSALDGRKYRLPTEAEWEYACRAGSTTDYNVAAGGSLMDAAWFNQNTAGSAHPQEVRKKKPNAFGLYDMHGNVAEWCEDFYTAKLPGGQNPLVEAGAARVCRGGSWNSDDLACRSAARAAKKPDEGFLKGTVGFRVCVTVENRR